MTALFPSSLGRYADDRRQGLKARIDRVVVERLREAIEAACLDTMGQARQRSGRPAPVEESADDRREFQALTAEFLELLDRTIASGEPAVEASARGPGRRSRPAPPGGAPSGDAALSHQVSLAKLLPDYWQQFESCRLELARRHR